MQVTTDYNFFFNKVFDSDGTFVLCGAGNIGSDMGLILNRYGVKYDFYCDQNQSIVRGVLNNKRIISLEELGHISTDIYLWITNVNILSSLNMIEKVVKKENIIVLATDFNYINHALAPVRRLKLKNREFTIISNNCNAGNFYKALGCRMDSPLINMGIGLEAYLRFVANIRAYMESNLEFVNYSYRTETKELYPLCTLGSGKLEPINIHFSHYLNFEEVKLEWERRLKRIHWDNIYFILSNHPYSLTSEAIKTFCDLDIKNKVVFTDTPSIYENVICTKYKFTEQNIPYEKWFDIVSWLNGEKTELRCEREI